MRMRSGTRKLIDAISTGPHGAIALAYVEWAGEAEQKLVVDWTVIRNAPRMRTPSPSAMRAAPRAFVGRTAIGAAIDFSFALIGATGFAAESPDHRRLGRRNEQSGSRRHCGARRGRRGGAVINGLTIFNRRAAALGGYLALHTNPPGGLAQYYRDNVIGGTGAFVVPIDDFRQPSPTR